MRRCHPWPGQYPSYMQLFQLTMGPSAAKMQANSGRYMACGCCNLLVSAGTDAAVMLPLCCTCCQVSLHEIGGLWIILASCLGVGLLWNILQQLAPHMRPNADAGDRGGGSSSMVASHLPSSPKHSASNGSVTLRPVPEAHESTLQEPEAEATPQALGWPQSTVGDRLLTLSTRLDKVGAAGSSSSSSSCSRGCLTLGRGKGRHALHSWATAAAKACARAACRAADDLCCACGCCPYLSQVRVAAAAAK